jgi:uncharacterized membrane protein YeaQ/YmgE (transglycosylase-associated protein family)
MPSEIRRTPGLTSSIRAGRGVARELLLTWTADVHRGGSMHIITTLIVGLVVGALAKLFMPGKDPGGIIITIVLGVAGAFLARLIGRAVGWYAAGDTPGILLSILGAIVLLSAYRLIIQRRKPAELFKRDGGTRQVPPKRPDVR